MEPGAWKEVVGQREDRSSIELTRNAKGDYQYVVKVYYDATELAGKEAALLAVVEIEQKLRNQYVLGLTRDLAPELEASIAALQGRAAPRGG